MQFFPCIFLVLLYSFLCSFKLRNKGFPGDPVAKTECSQSREPRFNPWSRNWIPYTTTTKSHMPQKANSEGAVLQPVTGRTQIKKKSNWETKYLANLFSQITDQCCNSGLHVQITHASYLTQETFVLKLKVWKKKKVEWGLYCIWAFAYGPQILQHSLVINEPFSCQYSLFFFFQQIIKGNSLAVQWLRLRAFTAKGQIQPLVRELRSHKSHGTSKIIIIMRYN